MIGREGDTKQPYKGEQLWLNQTWNEFTMVRVLEDCTLIFCSSILLGVAAYLASRTKSACRDDSLKRLADDGLPSVN